MHTPGLSLAANGGTVGSVEINRRLVTTGKVGTPAQLFIMGGITVDIQGLRSQLANLLVDGVSMLHGSGPVKGLVVKANTTASVGARTSRRHCSTRCACIDGSIACMHCHSLARISMFNSYTTW